jgi:hypothetical protein
MGKDKEPATLSDLDTWGGELTRRIDEVEDRLGNEIQGVKVTLKRVLTIVQSIYQDMKKLRDIPERVEQLEEDVLKLKSRR